MFLCVFHQKQHQNVLFLQLFWPLTNLATPYPYHHYKKVFEVHTLIIFQNDTKDCIKSIEPQSGVSIGTLFFGHSGDHYVVIKPWKKVKKMASAFLSILQIVV